MNISEKIIESCSTNFPMFGYEIEFLSESCEVNLNSTAEVNVLIGLSNGIKGNIVISFNQKTACNIISAMMGGTVVEEVDDMGKSALGEMANMIIGNAVAGLSEDSVIDLSPPTIATGKNMYIMISNIKASKIEFQLEDSLFFVSYALQ